MNGMPYFTCINLNSNPQRGVNNTSQGALVSNDQRPGAQRRGAQNNCSIQMGSSECAQREDPVSATSDEAASEAVLSLALSSFEQKLLGGMSIRPNLILLGAAAIAIQKLVPSYSFLRS